MCWARCRGRCASSGTRSRWSRRATASDPSVRAGAAAARAATPLGTDHRGRLSKGIAATPRMRVYLVDHRVVRSRRASTATPAATTPTTRGASRSSARPRWRSPRFGAWPDILHGHDWQAGRRMLFATAALRRSAALKMVLTIHNLAYQGLFSRGSSTRSACRDTPTTPRARVLRPGELPQGGARARRRDHHGEPALRPGDPDPRAGLGLDGLLRRARRPDRHPQRLRLRGLEPRDRSAPAGALLGADSTGKRVCKAALQRELGLPVRARLPLCGSISRLADRRASTWCSARCRDCSSGDVQYVVLGSGEPRSSRPARARAPHPSKLAVRIGYDEALAHRIEAGCDLYLMPSRYEPCGLNRCTAALRHAADRARHRRARRHHGRLDARSRSGHRLQVRSRTTPRRSAATWRRAVPPGAIEHDFAALMRRAMAQDFSWPRRREVYAQLYAANSVHRATRSAA